VARWNDGKNSRPHGPARERMLEFATWGRGGRMKICKKSKPREEGGISKRKGDPKAVSAANGDDAMRDRIAEERQQEKQGINQRLKIGP